MSLAAAYTPKTRIGPAELRISSLAKAGLQTQSHSVGAVDSTQLEQTMNVVDSPAGFPQQPVDTAITSYSYQVTGVLRENSVRNLNVLFGNGVADYAAAGADVYGKVDNTVAIADGATSLTMDISFTGTLAVGDTITVYSALDITNVNVCKVLTFTAKAGATPASMTLETTTPITKPAGATNAFDTTDSVYLYKNALVLGGQISVPVYFSVRMVQIDRSTGRPIVLDIWKATLAGQSTLNNSVTEWSTPNMVLKILKPTVADYATGGPLNHMAKRILTGSVNNSFAMADAPDVL